MANSDRGHVGNMLDLDWSTALQMEGKRIKKSALIAAISLLLASAFPNNFSNVCEVSATIVEDLCYIDFPPYIPSEPMSENFTTEDYLNTTNPYDNSTLFSDFF